MHILYTNNTNNMTCFFITLSCKKVPSHILSRQYCSLFLMVGCCGKECNHISQDSSYIADIFLEYCKKLSKIIMLLTANSTSEVIITYIHGNHCNLYTWNQYLL